MDIKRTILSRIGVVYVVTVLVALAITGQVVYIQTVSGDELREEAATMSETHKVIPSSRGNILDRNGFALASSVPRFEIAMDPSSTGMSQDDFDRYLPDLASGLARLFPDRTAAEYQRMFREGRLKGDQHVMICKDASYDQKEEASKLPLFRLGQFKGGFIARQTDQRKKPYKLLAFRTIGYVKEGELKVGIEGRFDDQLKGTDGIRIEQRITGGTWMPVNTENVVDPVDGADVVTTIDVAYQDVAESALLKCMKDNEAEYGCTVLMEVATGEILAIANLGRADDGEYYELKNYAINDCLEPGSTFKVPALMAALEDNYVQPETLFETYGGKFSLYNQQITDSHTGGYGTITVQQILEKSSNIGMARIIDKYYSNDPKTFLERLTNMGVNKHLDLEIEGAQDTRMKTPSDQLWSKGTVPWMAFGYEVEMTPLQILTFYNAIANNGVMVKPRFIRALRTHSKNTFEYRPVVLKSSICSPETLSKIRSMLVGVVQEGTAKNLQNDLYQIAGKTGTAVISQGARGYKSETGGKAYRASFVGYFPAENPKYSCIVVVSRPSKESYYGAIVSGTVFKSISDKVYATDLTLHKPLAAPTDTTIDPVPYVAPGDWADAGKLLKTIHVPFTGNQRDSAWTRFDRKGDALLAKSFNPADSVVPDFTGMGLKDVLPVLENMGLRVRAKGSGRIIYQWPPAGARRDSSGTISFQLSVL